MKLTHKVLPPVMPNVEFLDQGKPGQRQDGFQPTKGIPIEDLTEKQAEEFSELMKTEFMSHWRKKVDEKITG